MDASAMVPVSAITIGSFTGIKRASRSHLKIRLALTAYRRATCATDTPDARV
jgi:hypothetical protein